MAQILSAAGYDPVKPKADKEVLPCEVHGSEISHHELINQYFEDEEQY